MPYMPNPDAPALVNALAEQAGGHPIAWKVGAAVVVIVFEDGRKLTLDAAAEPTAPVESTEPTAAVIDVRDGVDDVEAAAAGRALNIRKKKKGG